MDTAFITERLYQPFCASDIFNLFLNFLKVLGFGCVHLPKPKGTKGPSPDYSRELESKLRQWLFDGYDFLQRPRKLIDVKTSLNLLSLNYMDIKEQKLSVTAYFYFVWVDRRLRWVENSTYDNIKFLFSNEHYVWKPAIIVENSVDHIDVLTKPNVPMRIISVGKIAWMPAGIFITHCESDITYWPLDTQTCSIVLSSWAYTAKEVLLEFDDLDIVMTFYQENGEWELIKKVSSTAMAVRELESFSRLIFTLKFRRRPLFHMLNTLFPVFLMGFLTVAIFKLSPESGERVGLALTVLLAYAVYLSLISGSIPQTSISTSLLSTYLASILFLQTLSVLLTVIYIDIYFTPPDKNVPQWLQTVASSCLSKLACIDCCRKTSTESPDNMDRGAEKESTISSIEDIDSERKQAWNEVNDSVKEDNEEDSVKQYTWKEIALMLDKVTMYIYLLLVTVFTGGSMIIMLVHFNTAYSVV